MSNQTEGTGWTPAYTLKCVLIQMQNFLSEHDFYQQHSTALIKKLFDYNKQYTCQFENSEGEKILHTYEKPYPEIYTSKKTEEKSIILAESNKDNIVIINSDIINNNEENNKILNEVQSKELESKSLKEDGDKLININEITSEVSLINLTENTKEKFEIKNNLTCYVTKSNYLDDNSIILGYPIFIQYGNRKFNDYIPIPEILSYDAFSILNLINNSFLDNYYVHNDYTENSVFKSSMGEYFSHWFPIYLDKNHFEKNKEKNN